MNGAGHSSRVLCAGRLYCDLVFTGAPRFPSPGTETFAEGLGVFAGGGAFNTAATFCALGRPAALLAVLPADPFQQSVIDEIAGNGVDRSRCTPAAGGTDPQVTVAIVTEADRAFLSRRAGAALPPLVASQFTGFGHLHIGELSTVLEHPDLIDHARAAAMTISLDCGWDDALEASAAALPALIGAVDVFLPNESEAAHLADLGVDPHCAPLTVIKCGAAGAHAHGSGAPVSVAAPAVDVVDTTGAGDAFNGGFVDAWLTGAPIADALRQGNRCGAAVVRHVGSTRGLDGLRLAVPDRCQFKNQSRGANS